MPTAELMVVGTKPIMLRPIQAIEMLRFVHGNSLISNTNPITSIFANAIIFCEMYNTSLLICFIVIDLLYVFFV
jgi:hypothetical protein